MIIRYDDLDNQAYVLFGLNYSLGLQGEFLGGKRGQAVKK
jgi:hypothetical protein